MNYYKEVKDERGYIHSIDEVTVDFYVKDFNQKNVIKSIARICALSEFEEGRSDWDFLSHSKLDLKPSTKYNWFNSRIWCNGFFISIGQWTSFDKVNKDWTILPIIRINVNPNKHGGSALWNNLKKYIAAYCDDGMIVKYDYAIDVPVSPEYVNNIGSRKEPGLNKGTRYYGQRGRHGRIKIYDKQAEQKLDYPLTRVEYTFKTKEKRTFDNIVVMDFGKKRNDYESLSRQLRTYVEMLNDIEQLGGDKFKHLNNMDSRTYKKIEPFVVGGTERLVKDDVILKGLLEELSNDLMISHDVENVNLVKTLKGFEVPVDVDVDDDGFISVSDEVDFVFA